MKITVFGSTGKAGLEMIRQALGRGYMVAAYARNPQKINFKHPDLTVVKGDLTDLNSMKTAIQGSDCVISLLKKVTIIPPARRYTSRLGDLDIGRCSPG